MRIQRVKTKLIKHKIEVQVEEEEGEECKQGTRSRKYKLYYSVSLIVFILLVRWVIVDRLVMQKRVFVRFFFFVFFKK